MKLTVKEVKEVYKPKLLPIIWKDENNTLTILDQSLLPFQKVYVDLKDVDSTALAIKNMQVRGAPAIGITAGYGMVLALTSNKNVKTLDEAIRELTRAKAILDSARPTAVNLVWATSRMLTLAKNAVENGNAKTINELIDLMKVEAKRIFDEEYDAEIQMGLYGLEKLNDSDTVLTQCNAGGLATGTGLGTALSPVKLAKALGMNVSVIAPETRPWLQGSRLTVYELMEEGIKVTLITDTAVGLVMYRGMVNSVMVGADRILRDGHVFNKIGTYKEAVIAHELGIPFYALAPTSSFDLKSNVNEIKIEERDPNEVRTIRGIPIAPENVNVYNPVFDVTPPKYIAGIITEKGIIYPPFHENIKRIVER
ncbi:S-methyl-5-thioribose-1-phosphate isomerase [Saccharolobus solfataricus]|uniref:Putative methylthioribose-1-phosphate isomerase n=3 Tax=Saccharolobus solfataricus TaxID=2287 RepID=Q97UM6_SACS2|nr:S-methyl-5-thioribose-1-phosphate isomerase [Saccharolobus solfataricus]AAK43082.1 Translation initiation factor aiF-2B, subunit 1 (eiF2B) [Saccharolobus solfataricus P2]AKA73136.1 S-methyl-5-thioribose-1-phosphate isomerase [Saccharolobus solfataricus]AKA75834.1 S-methyl-5-thioribose-1-phosphate isomerase [Saccharolobus solfataricus]AKA78526.1 S-methyl-5-thioribose-1-phosphate isomerase [Saccharolobus solfataricus]AZF67637.1 S-methyl-5-thioribose-1-phosphate isomerase [Saccharolobus solfat